MVIDSSVFLAILYEENETAQFLEEIGADQHCLVSAASVVEVGLNLLSQPPTMMQDFEEFLRKAQIYIIPVDVEQSQLAIQAARVFGKGRHPAGLNFGDCFAYALSKQTGEPLLFKGNDFARTDVARVL
jgi:ribonuclease VapC